MFSRKHFDVFGNLSRHFLKELLESGKVVPVIDRAYPLSEAPEAIRYLEEGHPRGNVVITVEHNNKT